MHPIRLWIAPAGESGYKLQQFHDKENDMFPDSTAAWIFILVTCFTSFMVGQWLRSRRKKERTHDEYIDGLKRRALAETRDQTKKGKKTKKKKMKRGQV
jgi:hypothetical protein